MALYRPPLYCYNCGKQLQEIHEERSHFFGDTFIGYKECECKEPNVVQNVQASVARDGDSSNAADYKKQLEDSLLLYNNQTATIEKLQSTLKEKEVEIVRYGKWVKATEKVIEAMQPATLSFKNRSDKEKYRAACNERDAVYEQLKQKQ